LTPSRTPQPFPAAEPTSGVHESPRELNDKRRNGRHREQRATTVNNRKLRKLVVVDGGYTPPNLGRPRTRGDCEEGERPCPYVSCKHNLYLDVTPAGSLKLNFPDLEPHEMTESCSLDIADRGGVRLEDVGALMNITRERIRQVEVTILKKLYMSKLRGHR